MDRETWILFSQDCAKEQDITKIDNSIELLQDIWLVDLLLLKILLKVRALDMFWKNLQQINAFINGLQMIISHIEQLVIAKYLQSGNYNGKL